VCSAIGCYRAGAVHCRHGCSTAGTKAVPWSILQAASRAISSSEALVTVRGWHWELAGALRIQSMSKGRKDM
jgi:hypothetical protein